MSLQDAPAMPADPIFSLSSRCQADSFPKKVNLSVGAYRSNDGKPWLLPTVRKVDLELAKDPNLDHEYQPIGGVPEFVSASAKLILGPGSDLSRVASVQTLSGTGANHMGAVLLRRFHRSKTIWVTSPTWGNHHHVFKDAGLTVKSYPYWDANKRALAFDEMIQTLETQVSEGDIVLLHACAHNPTGVDPTREQWKKIAEVVKRRHLFAFFDCAYQGFASGDLDNDAWAVRYFVDQKVDLLICQSFAKNMGLYGERIGALHVALSNASAETAHALRSQLEHQTRGELSTCPAYGARIVSRILNNPVLFQEWKRDIVEMSSRIIDMRAKLKHHLVELGTPGTWDHITSQIGMFSFTGLTPDQVHRLVEHHHIYLLQNGRISMAGINESNVERVAQCFHDVIVNKAHL